MDNQITEFIDILKENSFIAKQYCPQDLDETYNPEKWDFRDEDVTDEKRYSYDVFMEELDLGQIFKDELTLYEFHGYQKPTELEDFLISQYEKFNNALIKNNYLNDKIVKKEIVNQVRLVKNQLDNLLNNCEFVGNYLLESLIKVKIEICAETIRLINFPIIVVESQSKPVKPKKDFENLTSLTQNQIVILFYCLQELKHVGNGMTNIMFATQVSELSGFSMEGIRKGFSHISKDSTSIDGVKYSESDFSKVRREMKKVVAILQTKTEERFPPNP